MYLQFSAAPQQKRIVKKTKIESKNSRKFWHIYMNTSVDLKIQY